VNRFFQKKYLLSLIILIAILLFVNFFISKTKISVSYPHIGPAVQAVYATGQVEATSMVPLNFRASAIIKEIYVEEGAKVEKGQLIAQLDDQNLLELIKEQEARVELARSYFKRQQELITKNATSKDTLEKAQADALTSSAILERLKIEASHYKMYAPDNGVIIKKDGEPGQLVSTNENIFWLSNGELRVTAEIDEEDIPLIKIGQKVTIRADAFPQSVYYGEVTAITPKGDPIARSFRIRISLPKDSPLSIGMTTENNIVIRVNKNALLVPSTSIFKNKIFVLKNNSIEERIVTTGAKGNDYTEITSGLDSKELVITEPTDIPQNKKNIEYKLITKDQ
jgi:multidrug efflux system membrane fusion protein